MQRLILWTRKSLEVLRGLMVFLGATLTLFLTVSISYGALSRYALGQSLAWVTEVSAYSLLFLAFLGAAEVLRRDGHVNVDILLNALRPRPRAMLNLVTALLGLLTSLLLLRYGLDVTMESFRTGQVEVSILQIPKHYLLGVIPLGSFFLGIGYVEKIRQYLRVLREKDGPQDTPGAGEV